MRSTLPNSWFPINVIKHSKDELARIITEDSPDTPPIRSPVFGLFEQPEIKQVVGQFEINLSVMEQLKRKWHNAPCKLVCGADGGLKECIGTNGYVVYMHPEEAELLRGHSAEIQLHENASVTRQELLGQLAIDFWLQHMVETFGEPNAAVEVHIVTDSQASIDIVSNVQNKIGIKDVLKPDTDVALAILHQRAKLPWMKYHMIKVKSHIAVEEAPNEFFWRVNDTSDQLATEARDKAITNEVVAKRPRLLPGMVLGCKIGNELIYQDLKVRLHKQLHEDTLYQYLCSKYGWTDSVAQMIDWTAHEQALNSFTLLQRITITKFIHGWLVTKKRRCRDGAFANSLCPLCRYEEEHLHMFTCPHEKMVAARTAALNVFDRTLKRSVDATVVTAIQTGMRSLTNPEAVSIFRRELVVDKSLEEALLEQAAIGWNHFLYGRISKKWKKTTFAPAYNKAPDTWAKYLVILVLNLGRSMWQQRNNFYHGNDGSISRLEEEKTHKIIHQVYDNIAPTCLPEHKWMFEKTLEEQLQTQYALQIAWLDGVRRLYPVQHGESIQTVGNQKVFDQEM